jgi:FHA domain
MSVPQEEGAWLEAANGRRYPIKGSCSLGRSGANTIVLESPKVSRRHALRRQNQQGPPFPRRLIDPRFNGECAAMNPTSKNDLFLATTR